MRILGVGPALAHRGWAGLATAAERTVHLFCASWVSYRASCPQRYWGADCPPSDVRNKQGAFLALGRQALDTSARRWGARWQEPCRAPLPARCGIK